MIRDLRWSNGGASDNKESSGYRVPCNTRDVPACLAFAAVVAGIASADASALGSASKIVRIPVRDETAPYLGVEIQGLELGYFAVTAVEPWFRSAAHTLATLDAFVEAVTGRAWTKNEGQVLGLECDSCVEDVTPDVAMAFALVQWTEPAVMAGVLPTDCRELLAASVTAAWSPLVTRAL
ncbi:MAG: hypothetical protein ACR2M1_04255 [Gemmatimonadaceae bacterium]